MPVREVRSQVGLGRIEVGGEVDSLLRHDFEDVPPCSEEDLVSAEVLPPPRRGENDSPLAVDLLQNRFHGVEDGVWSI